MPNPELEKLRNRLSELADLHSALSLLHWDQQTYMPPKGATARAEQLATLSATAHRMFTEPEFGDLLRKLEEQRDSLSEDEAKLVSETLYDYERATKLPESLVKKLAEAESHAFTAWEQARSDSNYSLFRPHLALLVDLQKEKAERLGYTGSPYNALLEDYERGMTAERLKSIFAELAARQSVLIDKIAGSSHQPDVSWLDQRWEDKAQWDFGIRVLRDMGFDFEAGRQDRSSHPFTTELDLFDVRITTRIDEGDLFSGLSSSIHEGGHALYEQGFREEDRKTTLAQAPSLGMHESQSRLWENLIGRSRAFWEHYFEPLKEHFPGKLDSVSVEDVYRACNRVRPSLIRVEADECTYNLHIILRFEIELALVEGDIGTEEVPEMWRERMKSLLGLEVPDDARGCLQDIHWSGASFGYFPTYALGNLYAAQIFETLLADIPALWDQLRQGNFAELLEWLRVKIHRVGRRKTAPETVRGITGKDPGCEPYLRYLETKYSEIYQL